MKSIFVIVLVIFMGETPIDGKVGGPFESMAECEAARKNAAARAKEQDVDAALVCVEVKHKLKPAVLKQRGGNA